uniref:Global nitrogen transcriptional regulator n=1 Tax=Pleonosporium borreri TaxID=2575635 RepID=A0A4D6WYJ7_9FLOR|nr:global nitrogen transcriptional regulator [Pleonosporium borreri]
MKYIYYFSKFNISYYIYEIKTGDSIIFNRNYYQKTFFIILDGLVLLSKHFTNTHSLSIAILSNHHIIFNTQKNITINYYYKVLALKNTYLISLNKNEIYKHKKLIINIINSYELTLDKYSSMNDILANKLVKYRLLQLLFFLSKEFGIIKKQYINIPFTISKYQIGIIIGSNQNTINKLLKNLSPYIKIEYINNKKIQIKDPFHLIHKYCY